MKQVLEKLFDMKRFSRRVWKIAGALTVAGFLILMIVLISIGSAASLESPVMLALLNSIFLCAIPLIIAYEAANSYRATGVVAFFLVGCGLVFFGASGFYAGWVMPLASGANPTVTLHNLGAFFAGLCEFLGAHFFLRTLTGFPEIKSRIERIWVVYLGILCLVSLTAVLVFRGNLPVFFDPVSGPSVLRQIVLGGAVFLFTAAGFAFLEISSTNKTEFAFWYGLALWLITIGLASVMLQPSVASALGWTGRGAQYVGCVFMMIAFVQGRREFAAAGRPTDAPPTPLTLWPYLERRVSERTEELLELNAALQKQVSLRKRTESALAESEEKYRTLVENAFEAIYVVQRGVVVFANRMAAMALGLPETELIGQSITGFVPAHSRAATIEHHQRLLRGEIERDQFEMALQPNGESQRWIHINAVRIIWKGEPATLNLATDISERRRTEEMLLESEEKYRTFVAKSSEGIVLIDERGQIIEWNHAIELITGIPRSAALGRSAWDIEFSIMPAARRRETNADEAKRSLTKILETGQSPQFGSPVEIECESVTGEAKFISQRIFPIKTDLGYRLGIIVDDVTQRKQAEHALQETTASLSAVFNATDESIFVLSASRTLLDLNDVAAQRLGNSREELIGRKLYDLLPAEVVARRRPFIDRVLEQGESVRFEDERNGRWMQNHMYPLLDAEGHVDRLAIYSRDITERKQGEQAQKESEAKYRLLFENMQEGFALQEIMADENGRTIDFRFLDANAAYERHTGLKPQDIIGKTIHEIIPHADPRQIENYGKVALTGEPLAFEYYSRSFERYLRVRAFCPQRGRFATILEDITERRLAEDKLQQQATTDELTRVFNRRHFLELTQSEMKRTKRLRHPLCIALIDVDHFKQINDTHGHATGDLTLTAFAEICQQNIREIDIFARVGGDEFALLLPEADRAEAHQAVERVRQALAERPIEVEGKSISITLSSGIVCLTEAMEDVTVEALLARADAALYGAKQAGRNRVHIAA
jgi:diguanylate cyclase (GGDEF)-like protein/PAS domain S-box-containing protein